MLLEICTNSYQSAKNAQEAGAHRIELCQELSVGGITPSYGLLKQVTDTLSIPVFVLIRPRSGNFVYTEEEFDIMKQDIQLCKNLGCAGIVSGILNKDNTIDIERTKELLELSRPLQFTFHRAFDCVKDPKNSLEQLIALGVDRILNSGLETSAEKGLNLLKQLQEQANGRITILAGSGINSKNAKLFKEVGFNEIHASASTEIECNGSLFSTSLTYSDTKKIKALLDEI
ncbi:copper homeostasis protein CutC [Flavobacteriaceae bacterium S0825]|uniref:copper homeostasis protein CutC n=1 Tax=Gaetbulibacter sp. S0825 TaxID=2720084 RepID=UPI001430C308|nr:copper homeostasis protein CutC [Gaetbulibacter sp. S0825]MCK0109172.1 copper homeostasis protein CutC [Flavobacteriaceae bacterium S0825]NIX64807.1 copper homeostasis protein CutC [Gaetbulibacter sp. S0825]